MRKPLATVLLCLLLTGCDSGQDPPSAVESYLPPVTVARVLKTTAVVSLEAIGTVRASATVEVKTRVDGQLVSVHFKEGQEVRADELLFTIDPAPYEAALKEASSRLASDKAQTQKALADLKRYGELVKNKVISAAQYEEYATIAAVRQSIQDAAEAAVQSARLRLSWCYIHAPISGPTGVIYSHSGNLVKANDDKPLVVIQQVQPIEVSFTLPEQYLASVRRFLADGGASVQAVIPGLENFPETGVIYFVDNAVDSATGAIQLKASFANPEKRLWPGQFVNVKMTSATLNDALLAPASAVQTGPSGHYVFTVEGDTAAMREVETGPEVNGKSVVITSGLQEGQLVVTEGQLRLVPGIRVNIRNSIP
jgi:multidrug efflux system membrane fusion protein